MSEISIYTFKTWEEITNIFGTYNSPVYLKIDIKNETNGTLHINKICVSVKTLFWGKDILPSPGRYTIPPRGTQVIQFDIQELLRNYKPSKRFTIKVDIQETNKSYESDVLRMNQFT